jgi:2-dehydropantoate 2-reductase
MRILVLGAGGTGGFFGGRLLEAGQDVTFLVRPRRAEQLRANGLVLRSPLGDACLKAPFVEDAAGHYDLVILSNKAYDLDPAMDAIAPAVDAGAAVLPLLNGMRHLDALDARFGQDRILGGWCAVSTTLDPDGTVRQLTKTQLLKFGERDGGTSARVEAIEAAMSGAKFEGKATPEIVQEMWEKWVALSTLAGMTCLMRASVGVIMDAPGGEAMMVGMYDECARVATAYGFSPAGEASKLTRAALTQRGSGFTASMLRDVESGGRTEADHILGDLLLRAEAKGLEMPLLKIAYCHLKAYELRREKTND